MKGDNMHSEQLYITKIADRLGVRYKIVHHDIATITCKEKADLLRWPVDRIIKAIYLHPGDYSALTAIVAPELGRLDYQKIISKSLGITPMVASNYTNGYMPTGMSRGTCTPFPRESSMVSEIEKIIVYDYPKIDEELVDISLGDDFEDPFKVSMHISYKGIREILQEQFREKIVEYHHQQIQ